MLRFPSFALLPLFALSAAAQQPPSPRAFPPLPLPGGAPAQPAVAPASTRTEIVDGLEFPGSDVKDVLAVYERLSGKRLVYDVQAIGQVNIVVKQKITADEAMRIIEVSLLMNGFTLVKGLDDTIKVLGTGRNPRGFGVPIISDELLLPENEQVVTFAIKLRYADATDVGTLLSSYIAPSSLGYSQVLPLPKSQTVLVTENSLIVRKLLQIVREVDTPPAQVVAEFITLERADAKDVLEKLEKIFEKKEATGATTSPGGARPPVARTTPEGSPLPPDATVTPSGPNSVEINGGALSEDSIIVGKIKLTADTRTNRLHIVTRPVNLPFIRKLIHEFDADVPFGEPSIRPLKFVAAGDILPTIVDAITEPGQKQEGGQGGGRSASGTNRNTGTNTNDLSSRNSNFSNNGSNGLGGSGTGNGGSATLSESLGTSERDIVPEARIIGSTKIIADKRANTIIVLGNKEVKTKIFALLDELDVRAPQVMINTVIGELNLSNNQQFGVNYILNNGRRSGLLGTTNTTTGTTTTGTTTGTTTTDGTGTGSTASAATNTGTGALSLSGNNPSINLAGLLSSRNITQLATAGAGGFSGFIAAGSAFNAIVDALESTDRFKVVSRPSIFTSNNKKAIISSGEEIAVPVNITGGFNGSTGTTNGLVTQSSISYKTVALQLEVLPLINSDREVTLDIVQKIDQQSGSDTIDNNSIPRIATRALSTTVSVPNEGTLVLGGLIKQTEDRGTAGIPILGRLPLVGALFRKTTKDKTRTELVVLIRPVVTIGPNEDVRGRERAMEALNIEPDVEATIYPTNLRKKVRVETAVPMRRTVPVLRTDTSK